LTSCYAQKKKKLEFCGQEFFVKLAKTPEQRRRGLMGVKHLNKNEAMLFIFEGESEQSFWMKNVLIPLDIYFFTKDFKLINKETMKIETPLLKDHLYPTYKSKAPAQYILETASGALSLNEQAFKKCQLKLLF